MFQQDQQIGSYTLLRKLGRGGFGEVWLAEKRSQFVTKKVAVKLPLDQQVNFDAIRQEASLWEQASGHPNVLPIIDADIVDGQVLIVSEFADGGSLSDKLKFQGKLPFKQAIELTIGILNGLDFLHRRKIIHRDIKPQNILLQGSTPRLADFGISRAMQTTAISSKLVGTDAYMSPEAFDGKRSVQTDIWSVGVVLYQLLAGNLPFPQEHPSERIFAILTKEFPPLSNEIPPSLQRIVSKSLAKQTENRYQTANEMRNELNKCLFEIEHPTMAKTEVLHIPISNQTVTDVTNIEQLFQTQEPKKETAPDPFHSMSPAAQRIVEEAFKTEEPKKQFATNPNPSVRKDESQQYFEEVFEGKDKRLSNEPQKFSDYTQKTVVGPGFYRFAAAVIIGFIALLLVIAGAAYLSAPANLAANKNASNAVLSSTPLMNIEVVKLPSVSLKATVDGKNESLDNLVKFTAQNSFVLEYSIYEVDKFQLIINNKVIKLSKTPPLGGYTSKFEVTKDNLNEILQKGSNEKLTSLTSNSTSIINVELKVTDNVSMEVTNDGKKENISLSSGDVKYFSSQESLSLRYYRGLAEKVQLKVNDKVIITPKADQAKGNSIVCEITKDNLGEILQSGKINQ
jgi:serine/threonine protein kinase